MKITRLHVTDFLGVKLVNSELWDATLFSGRNGSGKSSLQEAIRFALLATTARVSLKKEWGSLVHEGKTKADVTVLVDGQEVNATLTAKGKAEFRGQIPVPVAMPYLLGAADLAAEAGEKRISVLLEASGVKMDAEAIAERLVARGCAEGLVAGLLPALAAGFQPAIDAATQHQSEARGEWKGITGEEYGSQKAEGWVPTEGNLTCPECGSWLRLEAGKLAPGGEVIQGGNPTAERAAAVHKQVQGWGKVREELGPSGVQADLVGDALGPVNDRLRGYAEATGWGQVQVRQDVGVTYSGRGYRLCSESERWRAAAMLHAAVAQVSGVNLVVLDRLDVLEPAQRGPALDWIEGLAGSGCQVIAFATLKAKPDLGPKVSSLWMEKGAI